VAKTSGAVARERKRADELQVSLDAVTKSERASRKTRMRSASGSPTPKRA